MRRREFLMASLIGGVAFAWTPMAEASGFDELRRLRIERDQSLVEGRQRPRRAPAAERRPQRAAPPPRQHEPSFIAAAGNDLQVTLSGWARQAGWSVVWQSGYSYELVSGSRFSGGFEDSVKALLLAMRHTRPNPTAVFYGGNRVLVISNNSQTATD